MHRRMETDPSVVVLGEDVHRLAGGTNGATKGLKDAFPERILGTRLRTVEPGRHPGVVTVRIAYAEVGGVRQLLQFAEHIRVLDPPEACRLVHDLATALADRHS